MSYATAIVTGAASLGICLGLILGVSFLFLLGLRWARIRSTSFPREKGDTCLLKDDLSNSTEPSIKRPPDHSSWDLIKKEGTETKTYQKYDAAPMPLKKEENKSDKNGFSISPDTVHVRELIEKLVETIIGGSLDGITVGKLSAHASYLAMFEKYHGLLCGELARLGLTLHLTRARSETLQSDESNSLRFSLSRLLQRIISEAMALPNLREILCQYSSAESGKMLNETPNDFESKCYEDILATAILNKVIENFQKPNKNEKLSENKKRHKCTRVKAGGMTDEESMYNSDWSEASASEPLSLTIEEHIEEVTTAYQVSDVDNDDFSDYEMKCKRKIPFPESGRVVRNAESDDEISESEEHSHVTELVMSTPSWEKNWLFQKKRVQCTPNAHHPVPVPMLVPNPSEDFRALVGGVDADDLSEMSDCDDSVLEDLVTEDSQAVNATSKSTCGTPEHIVLNEKETRHDEQDEDYKSKATTNDEVDNELTEKEIHEKKAVLYESTYKLYKIADITPHYEEGTPEEKVTKTATWFNDLRENASHTKTEGAISQRIEICEHEKVLRCPIAEREKEKWKNPVSIPDNPYSSENIEKREQRRRPEYFRTGNYFRDAINFPDYDSSREIFSADNNEKLRVTRDYYVNGIKNFKTGALPVSMATKNVNGKNQRIAEAEEDNSEKSMPPLNHPSRNYEFRLPSVKKLAKQFTADEIKTSSSLHSNERLNTENGTESNIRTWCSQEKEPEIDYSSVPISEIILNLKNALSSSNSSATPPPRTRTDQVKSKGNKELIDEKGERKTEKIVMARFNAKEIHSLTARSISREFREGLKSGTDQNHKTVVNCFEGNEWNNCIKSSSPTPSIDLKNMKKFWEEIITANAKLNK